MKILIIHASAGAGHTKAAEALYNGIKNTTSHQVVLADALDFTNPFHRYSYRSGYSYVVTKLPWLWGAFFALTDLPWVKPAFRYLRRIFNALIGRPLVRFLEKENFDYILSTHFFANDVAGTLKRQSRIRSKIISVVTDFDVHGIWVVKGIDFYAAACEYTRDKLLSLGVDKDRIIVSGIPTDTKFSKPADRNELKAKLGLMQDVFTVLLATGSFGSGPIEAIAKELEGFQVVVICGRNQALFEKLTRNKMEHVKVQGLVNNMDEFMKTSDCMVTKPGGLSISEALVVGLPLIFFNAIPGQEINNVQVLKKYGIGAGSRDVSDIIAEIKRLHSSQDALTASRSNIHRLAKPAAVSDIIKLIQ